MEIVKAWVEVEKFDGKQIMKNLERACRTCYRSEDLIKEDSYKGLLSRAINRGHESILEHEKITIRMYTDIGAYKDLTRHRAGTAWSVESTRYCNYSKDKFTNNIKFIDPVWMCKDNKAIWKKCMANIEKYYMQMAATPGVVTDELRMVLPHSTAAEVTMTCNIREWRHIFSLRCAKMSHPSIRQVLIPVLLLFKKEMPELFDKVEYDTDFKPEWYADIRYMNDEN